MDDPRSREILAFYPWVVVRVQCDRCQRRGSYRLARLASKYGAEISLENLLHRLTADCRLRDVARSRPCHARLIDLDGSRPPPDNPPSPIRLRLIREEVTREEEERKLRREARRAIRGF